MEYTTRNLPGGVSAVALQGHLDPVLDTQISSMTALVEHQQRLVIDLSNVSSLPPIWLHALWRCASAVLGSGGSVAFVANDPHVLRALRSSGVAGILPVVATMDAAAAAVSKDQPPTENNSAGGGVAE